MYCKFQKIRRAKTFLRWPQHRLMLDINVEEPMFSEQEISKKPFSDLFLWRNTVVANFFADLFISKMTFSGFLLQKWLILTKILPKYSLIT